MHAHRQDLTFAAPHRSLKGITDIDMIHIHEGKSANSGAPIINLFPLGSTAFPSGVSPFKIPAGMTYKIAGSFNESALELAVETVGPTYNVAKFVTVSKLPAAHTLPLHSSICLHTCR
jgi:hypothetical protein